MFSILLTVCSAVKDVAFLCCCWDKSFVSKMTENNLNCVRFIISYTKHIFNAKLIAFPSTIFCILKQRLSSFFIRYHFCLLRFLLWQTNMLSSFIDSEFVLSFSLRSKPISVLIIVNRFFYFVPLFSSLKRFRKKRLIDKRRK